MDRRLADELLTTCRAVRKRLDLERRVDIDVVRECLDVALQAPTGSNAQGWRWLLVTDDDKKREIGALYKQSFEMAYGPAADTAKVPKWGDAAQMDRVRSSAGYLADHLHEVPVWLIPCVLGRVDGAPNVACAGFYGSVIPAIWSFQLALHARGLASAYTTLHLFHEQRAAEILGIPYETVTQAALIPVAWLKGDIPLQRATRRPLEEIVYLDVWKSPLPG